MTAPRTFFSDEVCCIAFWNNVVLVDIDGEMSALRMRTVAKAYRELLGSYPQIVAVVLMRPGTPVAGADARAEGTRFMKEFGTSLAHVAMVIEAKGIVAQMLRSVIRGINTITRNTNMTIESDLDDAIRTVMPAVISSAPRHQVATELSAAVTTVRSSFKSEPARVGGFG